MEAEQQGLFQFCQISSRPTKHGFSILAISHACYVFYTFVCVARDLAETLGVTSWKISGTEECVWEGFGGDPNGRSQNREPKPEKRNRFKTTEVGV